MADNETPAPMIPLFRSVSEDAFYFLDEEGTPYRATIEGEPVAGLPYDAEPLTEGYRKTPATDEPCTCRGRRWVEDQNFQPEDYEPQLTPGRGLLPCGFCNEGGWETDEWEPATQTSAASETEWAVQHGADFIVCNSRISAHREAESLRERFPAIPARVIRRTVSPWEEHHA